MKKVKMENDKLKSQLVPVEKVDCEVSSGQFKDECEQCCENVKVCFSPF